MERLKNESVNSMEWEKFLQNHPFATPFQTVEFYQFYNSVQGQKANVYVISEREVILALAVVTLQKESGLKGLLSRRAIIYGGCIIDANRDEVFAHLQDFIVDDLKHEVIYIEIRNYLKYESFDSALNIKWKKVAYLNYQIKLLHKTAEDIIKGMNYNRRREINLSFKEGATFDLAKSKNEVVILYNLLKELYQKRVKLPLPKIEFFLQLYESAIGRVFIVKHNENIIGGSFCIYHNPSSIFTYYYYGMRNYHPKIFPTHLAIYAAIEFGLQNNLKYIDLMGAGKPNEHYGVRNYKAAYGGELFEQNRYLYIQKPILYFIGTQALKILKLVASK